MTSFKTSLSGVEICNRALSLIAEAPIASFEEPNKNSVREAVRWYKPTVGWLLERHHWNLATTRVALALVGNTRPTEWGYAYARPGDAAFVKAIVPYGSTSAIGYYGALRNMLQARPFERVGSTIFSSIEAAYVDYVPYTLDETDFTEEFVDIIVLMLASRFAVPVAKKAGMEEKYRLMASQALDSAIARNRNENEPTYGDTVTETELVRGATYNSGYPSLGWFGR